MVEPSTEERAREVADRYWDRLLELIFESDQVVTW